MKSTLWGLALAAFIFQAPSVKADDYSLTAYGTISKMLQLTTRVGGQKKYVGDYKSTGDCELRIRYGQDNNGFVLGMDLLAGSDYADWQDILVEPPYDVANTFSVINGILTLTTKTQESLERGFVEISTDSNASIIPYIKMGGNKYNFLPFNLSATCRNLKTTTP